MSQVDRPELQQKPQPILTIEIETSDIRTKAKCPELGLGFGITAPNSAELAVSGLHKMIEDHTATFLDSYANGTIMNENTRKQIETAKKVEDALKLGFSVQDLIK